MMDQMVQKHPERWRLAQEFVKFGSPISNLRGLRDSLLASKTGGSPGSGGLRAEYLITLAQTLEGEGMRSLESLG